MPQPRVKRFLRNKHVGTAAPGCPAERSSARGDPFDKLTPCCPESSAPMFSSIATTPKLTAPSSATFSIFPPWTPAAAGSYLPCLPRKFGIHPSDGEKGQSHGGRKLLGSVLYLMCDNLPGLNEILAGERRDLLARGRGRLGNQDHDPVAQRRRNRPLSAHPSDSPWSWVGSFNRTS